MFRHLRIAVRQHVPLSARVQNPEHGLEYLSRGNRFTTRTIGGNVLLGEIPRMRSHCSLLNRNIIAIVGELFQILIILR